MNERSFLVTYLFFCLGQAYLPSSSYRTQEHLDSIATWSDQNLVKLNEDKCNYMIFTRAQQDFATRLTINNHKIEQIKGEHWWRKKICIQLKH